MKLNQLLTVVLLLAIANPGMAGQRTKAEKIKQLVEIKQQKVVLKQGYYDAVAKGFYNGMKEAYKKSKPESKIELMRGTYSDGRASGDRNYVGVMKRTYLNFIVDGKEEYWVDGVFMLYVDVELKDENLRTLWTKRYEWPKGYYSFAWIRKVGSNGNMLLTRPPLIEIEFVTPGTDSTIYEVLDKKGKTIFRRAAGYYEVECYHSFLTANGRYLYLAIDDYKESNITHQFYDLDNSDSLSIKTIYPGSSVFIHDDGSIRLYGDKDTVYYFPKTH